MSEFSFANTSNTEGTNPQEAPDVPKVLMLTFSGVEVLPKRLKPPRPPFFANANTPNAVPAIPTICSHRVVNSMQFSYELLHVTM